MTTNKSTIIIIRLKHSYPQAVEELKAKYVASLLANWKIWTVPQIVNINLVAPQYRVLFANCVALVWNFYLAGSTKIKNK